MEHQICVTTDALEKLQALLDRHRLGDAKSAKSFAILEEELERAQVVEPHAVPPDVITMNSEVRLSDLESGEIFTYRLVYPSSKAQDPNAVSVMAPIGMAYARLSRRGDDRVAGAQGHTTTSDSRNSIPARVRCCNKSRLNSPLQVTQNARVCYKR